MSDLVERLRSPLGVMKCEVSTGPAPENKLERRWLLALEAAARIEKLEAALREIAKHPRGGVIDTPEKMDRDEFIGIARAALEGKGDE